MTARVYHLPAPSQGTLADFRRRMRATGGRPCSVVPMPTLDAHLARRVAHLADPIVCTMARHRSRVAAVAPPGPDSYHRFAYGWRAVRQLAAAHGRVPSPAPGPGVYVITKHAAGWVPVALLERASRPERTPAP